MRHGCLEWPRRRGGMRYGCLERDEISCGYIRRGAVSVRGLK